VKIVNKYQCTVTVFSHLQNFLDSLAINTSNEDEITAYYAYFRPMKKVSQNIVSGIWGSKSEISGGRFYLLTGGSF
jgi:hypothetical protein